MLALVVTDRDDVGLVEEDVARHQDGVGEERGGDEVLLGRLLLELGHAAELAVARHGRQQPGRLGVRGYVALDEDGRALGVEAGREQHRGDVERALAQRSRVVLDRDRVQVDDAEEGLALFLRLGVLAEAPAVVADVGAAGGLDAAEDPQRASKSILSSMAVTGSPELLIVMGAHATPEEVEHVVARLAEAGADAHVTPGREATTIGAIGDREALAALPLEGFPGVEQVLPILKPYKLVSRELVPGPTVIEARGRRIGDGYFGLIAGPCAVEYREQTLEAARAVASAGATMLRGGAFKPRTSPYAFQGLGDDALAILREARDETGLPVVTELMDPRHVEAVLDSADVIQIGARNMQNFLLLAEVGRADKPVLLKRGLSSSVEELLMAAEYVAKEGNERIILCERGIKTFETSTRYTLDLGAVAVLKQETHLPVIVDPSHAAGKRELVLPLARAAAAVGADGIIVETHPRPEEALSDGPQQIPSAEFGAFAREVEGIVALMGKQIG